ncbi:MAG: nucleotidyltransferase family protein [Bacteroidales bacterium]
MKAMLFAAGLGSRLGELTRNAPKALVTINGKSILRINTEKLTSSGFDEIIVNVHHFPAQVLAEIEKLKSDGLNITVSDETDLLLETGGGLYKARWFFDDKPFLVYNTDILTDCNLTLLHGYHLERGGLATLAVRDRPGNRMFLINNDGLLCGWQNRNTGEKIVPSSQPDDLTETGFSGIHVIDPTIFEFMKEGKYSLTTLYLELIKGNSIYTWKHNDGYWFDVGTPEILDNARKHLKI